MFQKHGKEIYGEWKRYLVNKRVKNVHMYLISELFCVFMLEETIVVTVV